MAVFKLMIINFVAFLLLQGAWMLFPEGVQPVVDALALPASFAEWLQKPWTLISYSVVHLDFRHLAVNLLWLGCVGMLPIRRAACRQIYYVYVAGALAGGISYLAAGKFIAGPDTVLVGCSAATFGILGAVPSLPFNSRHLFSRRWLYLPGSALVMISCLYLSAMQAITHISGFLAGVILAHLVILRNYTETEVRQATAGAASTAAASRVADILLEKARQSGFNALNAAERSEFIKSTTSCQREKQ